MLNHLSLPDTIPVLIVLTAFGISLAVTAPVWFVPWVIWKALFGG